MSNFSNQVAAKRVQMDQRLPQWVRDRFTVARNSDEWTIHGESGCELDQWESLVIAGLQLGDHTMMRAAGWISASQGWCPSGLYEEFAFDYGDHIYVDGEPVDEEAWGKFQYAFRGGAADWENGLKGFGKASKHAEPSILEILDTAA